VSGVAVITLELGADGVFVALMHDVRSSDDIETVTSLDRFAARTARVRIGGEERTLTIYERGGQAYARLADL
jgi:hypothetical protein